MRGMRTKLMTWALVILGLAMLSTSVKAQIVIGLTNQVWKYFQGRSEPPGTGWQNAGYDDTQAGWLSGRGVFAGGEDNANVVSRTNTVLDIGPTGDRTLAFYFRTHFTFSGTDPSTFVLVSSNLVDDGLVIYINGTEAGRLRITGTPTYSTLAGQGTEGVFERIPLSSASVVPGDNVIAVEVHQTSATSSDIVFGMALHGTVAFAPRITTQPQGTNILQGRSGTLSVVAEAAPAPTYQWFDTSTGLPIQDATNTTLTISNMDASQAHQYHVTVTNPYGSLDSTPVAVGFIPDTFPPKVLSVTSDPLAPRVVTVALDESVVGDSQGIPDNFLFSLDSVSGSVTPESTGYNSTSNAMIFTFTDALVPGVSYTLSYFGGGDIHDYYGNALPDFSLNVVSPLSFRQGTGGYTGTQDTDLRFAAPDTAQGDRTDFIQADQSDGTPAGPTHALLRFDNIVGTGAGQIPPGSVITAVTLVLTSSGTSADSPSENQIHRMLVDWNEASTWNSMVDGISANDIEAASASDAAYVPSGTLPFVQRRTDAGLRQTVQAWVNGTPNYGWVILNTGTDGYRIDTSEHATEANRPTLIVSYTEAPPSRIEIVTQPSPTTVNEGTPATFTVGTSGSSPSYQWYKAPSTAIAGATQPTLRIDPARPSDAGDYFVRISNSINSTQSVTVHLTVTPDTAGPVLASAVGNAGQTTITLTFTDQQPTLDPVSAQNTANYTLTPALAVTSAVLNGKTVTLTTAPRVAGTSYSLRIQNVKDSAQALNPINPNPTIVNPLEQHVSILAFNANWKYQNSGCDQGTAWRAAAFDDSAWPSASGLLGWETTGGTLTALFNQGLNTNNLGLLSRTNLTNCGMNGTNITDYFRTTLNIPFSLSGAIIQVRHVTDDGAVFYFNGTEVGRYNMTNTAIDYLTTALSAPTEGVIRTLSVSDTSSLHTGNNSFAVEVHQDSFASSDVDWGAEVTAIFGVLRPTLRIVDNGGGPTGTITISWNPSAGTLQQKDSLSASAWTDSPGTGNPRTITKAGAARFYSLRQ